MTNDITNASLTFRQCFAYALPRGFVSFLLGPLAILQGIYATHFGFELTTIAAVLLVARIFDAVTDPVIGYLSDRYYARSGSRKPFILVGGILFVLSAYFLYVPPNDVGVVYFLFWFLAFFLSWTLFEIPHIAWGGEMAVNSQDKNKIYSMRSLLLMVGQILFFSVPLLPIFSTSKFTPQTLAWAVPVVGALMLPSLYVFLKGTPRSRLLSTTIHTKDKLTDNCRHLFSNRPFWVLMGAHICIGFAMGMFFALHFIYINAFLEQGEHFSLMYIAGLCTGLLTVAFWHKAVVQLGKKWAIGIGMTISCIGVVGTSLLDPAGVNLPLLIAAKIPISVGFVSSTIVMPSLLSEVADYAKWKFRRERAAQYFSIYTLMSKTNFAVGGALGLALAGWYGFDPAGTGHTDHHIFGLRLAIGYIPAAFLLLSLCFIRWFPLNERRYAIIRQRLDTRERRSKLASDISKSNPLLKEIPVSSAQTAR